jgi:DNA repair protein RecO (recombination protein O)
MQQNCSEAVVLHHIDYGEADRIVAFFSREQGLFKGFARNARKSRKRFGTALEPFSQVRIHWTAATRGDLVTLQEAELLDLRTGLRRNVKSLALAAYGCELVEALLGDGQPHPEVFDLLRAFLDHLAHDGLSREARLLFELRMLVLAGYVPHLLHCASCNGSLPEEPVAFVPARGGALCSQCAAASDLLRVSPMTLGTLARSLKAPVTLFQGFRFCERTLQEGRTVLTAALAPYLNRPLKSLSFMEQMLAGQARLAAIR